MADIKKLISYAKSLRAAGASEAEIRVSVDTLEIKLDQEAATSAEYAAPEVTDRQLAAINLERATQGTDPLLRATDAPRTDRVILSPAQISGINFSRAAQGLDELNASEIMRMNLRRATRNTDVPPEVAPKGMRPMRLAKENLERASRGMPELLPHPED